MNMEMKRKLETTIQNWAENDSSHPLLIQGARRVGKTFLVENCGKKLFGNGFIKLFDKLVAAFFHSRAQRNYHIAVINRVAETVDTGH